MSEAVFAKLPRFDDLMPPGGAQGRRLSAVPQKQGADEPAHTGAEAAFKQQTSKQLAEIEATLTALAGTITTVQQDARAQTISSVVAIAEQLFPQLSKQFLAEEIALHLEKMIPEAAAQVDIKAIPELADSLTEIIARSNHLSSVCTVTPEASPQGDRVTVSWKTGGLTFDFNGLLEACIGHLKTTHPDEGDKS